MNKTIPIRTVRSFRKRIYDYYHKSGRHTLPWRRTRVPYHILVSEIMLQQTQVERVIPKYKLFLKKFPSLRSVARTPLTEIISVWQGLGYNRRAVYLKQSANHIVSHYAGRVPQSHQTLEKLPGIGSATASAIVTFAFNQPVVFIETNIRAVFIHTFFNKKDQVNDNEILPIIERTLDYENPREWYYALMDYGVHLKRKNAVKNNRSFHYTKQSKFEGSVRQVRGEIIRLLSKNGRLTKLQIKRNILSTQHNIDVIIDDLQKDGLIGNEGSSYFIP